MTVTAAQIAAAKKHLENVDALAAACERYGFPFYLGCTILAKETGGRNIYGHDRGGAMSVAGTLEVTRANFAEFRSQIKAGKTSNGVGPMQITYKGFFPQMDKRGLKPWVPADNIAFGISLLSGYYKTALAKGSGVPAAIHTMGTAYNGNGSYGVDAVKVAAVWQTRVGTDDLRPRHTPGPTPAPGPVSPPVATVVASEVGEKAERTTFEGARTTTRTVAMITEARRLYRMGGGGRPPGISQGGYNAGGVEASAGTHDRDAIDWKTRLLSPQRARLWQRCLWKVGFASWMRPLIVRLWQPHTHSVPKGGDLSAGARSQVGDFEAGRDGLKGHRVYAAIAASELADRTWEEYLAQYKPPTVSLAGVRSAFAHRVIQPDVKDVQRGLNLVLQGRLRIDGDPGPKTKAAYCQVRADGVIDEATLTGLGITVRP